MRFAVVLNGMMMNLLVRILAGLLLAAAGYVIVSLVLVVSDHPRAPDTDGEAIDFATAIAADYSGLPDLRAFSARDDTQLEYRRYGDPTSAQRIVVLIHGSGWHGMQFHEMAAFMSRDGENAVIVPDLRGHGRNPGRRGDVDHIGQLEEDLADLIDHVSASASGKPVILGGHSSGGGLVVRFAGGDYGGKADAFVLLAPFLKHDAPTTKPNSGGWAYPATRRIIGLVMLNTLGITALNHLPVIAFAMPQSVLNGPYGATVTTSYTYRLNTSFAPRPDYGADLAAMDRPLLLIAGEADEAFDAARYAGVISAHTDVGTYHVVSGTNHIGILTDQRVLATIDAWLGEAAQIVAPTT